MIISDIKIRKFFEDGPMKAVVSVTFDGALAVHDIKVINARDKYFIVMPSRKNPDGTYRDTYLSDISDSSACRSFCCAVRTSR